MNFNYQFNTVDEALPVLLGELLTDGEEFGSRAGRTKELMHVGISLSQPWRREITLPRRKANIAAQIVETVWILAGRNDVAGLTPYLPRAADFSDDGVTWRAGYGPRLRNYGGTTDQLAYVVNTLKDSPGSRQAVATLWDPKEDTLPGLDRACNNWLSFSSRFGYVDLHVGIRSNDVMWGWSGINTFEWSVLLEIVAGLTGLRVGSLHFSTTSFHLYEQHWAKARLVAQDTGVRGLTDSPRFAGVSTLEELDELTFKWEQYENAIRTGQPVDVEQFPEPMMRSWLRVLQWYWSGDEKLLEPLLGSRLYQACLAGVKPAGEPQEPTEDNFERMMETTGVGGVEQPRIEPDFRSYVNALHAEKHAAYGDSWKRRGEPGILANIARKVDRIGTGLDTSDETQLDTAIDLLVYSAKYKCWLAGREGDPSDVAEVLAGLPDSGRIPAVAEILRTFDGIEGGLSLVDELVRQAYLYALSLWV